MTRGKNQLVLPHYKGGWAVKGFGNTKPTRVVQSLDEAIALAEGFAFEKRADVIIYGVE